MNIFLEARNLNSCAPFEIKEDTCNYDLVTGQMEGVLERHDLNDCLDYICELYTELDYQFLDENMNEIEVPWLEVPGQSLDMKFSEAEYTFLPT